jgi:hypothetical protein
MKSPTPDMIHETEEYSVPTETVRTSHNPNLTFKSLKGPFKKDPSSDGDDDNACVDEILSE